MFLLPSFDVCRAYNLSLQNRGGFPYLGVLSVEEFALEPEKVQYTRNVRKSAFADIKSAFEEIK